jgi:hypothetical protein
VRALLARPEVDEAVELGPVQALEPLVAYTHHLLDVRHADARERDLQSRHLRLDVVQDH